MARYPNDQSIQLDWVGPSKTDLLGFPDSVVKEVGYALHIAQFGGKYSSTKSLKGLGSSLLEIIENHQGNTYRAVYTVKFEDRIYVLHCFQKKSKTGVKTPQPEIDLIKRRLKQAQTDYKQRQRKRRAKK